MMRNPYASHTDYGDFYGLIHDNAGFLPSNVDGICERKGKFLVMEWKRENENLSKGQEYLLKAFAKLPNFIVLMLQSRLVPLLRIYRLIEPLLLFQLLCLQPIKKNGS